VGISYQVWVTLETASLEHFEHMPEENGNPIESEEGATLPPSPDLLTTEASAENPSSPPSPEASLPPEAQGEVNGGPLGCCLGVMIGLTLSLVVAVVGRIYANPLLPIFHSPLVVLILLRIVMAIAAIGAAILCGYAGWKIGKRFYREYEPPVIKDRRRKPKTKTRYT